MILPVLAVKPTAEDAPHKTAAAAVGGLLNNVEDDLRHGDVGIIGGLKMCSHVKGKRWCSPARDWPTVIGIAKESPPGAWRRQMIGCGGGVGVGCPCSVFNLFGREARAFRSFANSCVLQSRAPDGGLTA